MPKGASGAHVFECDDDQVYVVKFSDSTKTVVNEYVCGALSRIIGLPSPENTLVNVTPELIQATDDLRTRNIGIGLHHGSLRLTNAFDFDGHQVAIPSGITLTNADELPGVIVFDNWVINVDRNNVGNNLLQSVPPSSAKYWMVDFSHSFAAPDWNHQTLLQASARRDLMPVFPFLASHVTGPSSILGYLDRVEKVESGVLNDIAHRMPDSWRITPEERTTLAAFLESRKSIVRDIVLSPSCRGNFPNWRD